MTRTGEALLAAVIAAPADELPRLAYADFCEEQGDDGRAEFIRVQVEVARLGGLARDCDRRDDIGLGWALPPRQRADLERLWTRAADLLRANAAAWAPDPFAPLDGLVFRRGFVAEVTLPTALWLVRGPALVRAAPLEVVRLADAGPVEWLGGDWFMHEGGPGTSYLPPPIFGEILRQDGAFCGGVSGPGQTRYVSFPAPRGRFVSALSAACLSWARAAAVAAPPAAGV